MSLTETSFDLDQKYHRFFPLFENYIVDFKKRVDNVHAYATQNSNANTLVPTNFSWNTEAYNPNYFLTKVAHKTNNIA